MTNTQTTECSRCGGGTGQPQPCTCAVATHTPGEWEARVYGGWDAPRIWSPRGAIALLQHHESGPAEAEANAHLIAASPTLLTALRRLSAAAAARENVMGDPCALMAAQAELRDANIQAAEAIKLAAPPQPTRSPA